MSLKVKLLSSLAVAALLMTACSSTQNDSASENQKSKTENVEKTEKTQKEEKMTYAESFNTAVTELNKAKEGKDVDFDKVMNIYETDLQSLVQKRDSENEDTMDQSITTALQAGKDGTMDKVVVKQIFDKLMQKAFYQTIKHEFNEITEKWGNTEEVNKEMEEAKYFYAILKPTVQKRDTAYGTTMEDVINGGFTAMEEAIENDNQLDFQLGKQVVDKTLMKTFYYAAGALPNGYATKLAKEAKTDEAKAKVEQAEGWAFYQSIFGYLNRHAEEEAAYILKQFDLQTDVKSVDPMAVNKAFIRGFAKVALDEYAESIEKWGEDKSAITALEGALFIDIIGEDIKGIIGEEQFTTLTTQAETYLEAAKAKGDKEEGQKVLEDIQTTLNTVIEKAK